MYSVSRVQSRRAGVGARCLWLALLFPSIALVTPSALPR